MRGYEATLAAVLMIGLACYWNTTLKNSEVGSDILSSYDFVIVGGGTAGCILARRLSEVANVTVALLEAGGDDTDEPRIASPAEFMWLHSLGKHWSYFTMLQKRSCLACPDKRNNLPLGKTLGGSSSINAMMYMRGNKADYDRWEALGTNGWSYDDVLPYFKMSENVQIQRLKTSDYRGKDGPIPITETPVEPIGTAFIKSGKEMGYQQADLNGESDYGIMRVQSNLFGGERQSTATAYLKPVIGRPNLHVITNARVVKIEFEQKRATSVQLIHEATRKRVKIQKEVILCAGVIESPHLLLLSGVGPAQQLKEFNIPVVADLPVGQYLQNHVGIPYPVYTIDKPYTLTRNDTFSPLNKLLWKWFSAGPLASNHLAGVGIFNLAKKDTADRHSDILLILTSISADQQGEKLQHSLTWVPVLLHPRSTGQLRLNSSDPFDPPVVEAQDLEDASDAQTLIDGIRLAEELTSSKYFKEIGATMKEAHLGNCDPSSERQKYLLCITTHLPNFMYHLTGTCRMGSSSDPKAVVDSELRILGLDGIRIVDASVAPATVSGSTHAVVLMVAEKAAAEIRKTIVGQN